MRNKYAGTCRCGASVGVGEGYFQRHQGGWMVRCMPCVIASKQAKGAPLSIAQRTARQALGGEHG